MRCHTQFRRAGGNLHPHMLPLPYFYILAEPDPPHPSLSSSLIENKSVIKARRLHLLVADQHPSDSTHAPALTPVP